MTLKKPENHCMTLKNTEKWKLHNDLKNPENQPFETIKTLKKQAGPKGEQWLKSI